MSIMTRRGFGGGLVAGSGLLLAGCDALVSAPRARALVQGAEQATQRWQRLVGRDALAREFSAADISPVFKANGTIAPVEPGYQAHAAANFVDWRVRVSGLVERPLSLSLAQLQALPARSQITRHDCVEGWSAIGGWAGPPLALLLNAAGVKASARYVVFLCADNYGGKADEGGLKSRTRYYESIDLVDAWHPQTILALRLNNAALDVAHGAPVRLRVERQLGYKHAKYVEEIMLVDDLASFGSGRGGYWPDRGYEWYAGI
ncbi:DMSO/TMAO reductase YedYZ molybdopterin-dependent catalytic subunit [Polymorphobacter multimanifer]|uniref:DMSO/TMAO reductase YedYZ molybdopterin-dependent catalytic subunit n=1 Tax=Polymorphobacter multimanifer TaxID=1070431 RepID=A0A841L4T2_9SPHN|nr:molybdopterin-dependent oxidoreductase [Polymorphobacter multimanifer]MBB6227286.1 DMSO/TMAO reductase YedYZ molybdopterin-dependent catalytic subunit [Polymorphobacter multimanifer]